MCNNMRLQEEEEEKHAVKCKHVLKENRSDIKAMHNATRQPAIYRVRPCLSIAMSASHLVKTRVVVCTCVQSACSTVIEMKSRCTYEARGMHA